MRSLPFLNWKIGFLRVIGGSISTYKEFQMARQTLTTSLLDCQGLLVLSLHKEDRVSLLSENSTLGTGNQRLKI